MKKLLIINAGSSSMKFRVYDKEKFTILADGICERITVDGKIKMEFGEQEIEKNVTLNTHLEATTIMLQMLKENSIINAMEEIVGIGHRVVQGGEKFKDSTLVEDDEIEAIDNYSALAPLHNPGAVQVLKALKKLVPLAKNVAVFDTSFHQTMASEFYLYPVPRSWYENHMIRRYGMHGTSHKYIAQRTSEILNKKNPNIISCHLGNGASLAAIKAGKCINTSMGLTPLAGIMMGTRSGDIDPAIIEYMCKQTNKSVEEITNDLNKKSGMLGLSGVSSDMRDIDQAIAEGNEKAQEAMEVYTRKVANYIVQYQNDLENQVDAIVFTAGIGENASNVRKQVMDKVKTLNIKINQEINNSRTKEDHMLISTPDSEVKVFVVKTNEEMMIAKDLIDKADL